MRLIDADALKKEVETSRETTDAFIELIDEAHTVDTTSVMKIICTREEKEWLVVSLMTSEEHCLFEKTGSYKNCKNCRECLDKNIEWEIKDGEKNGNALS